MKKWITITQYIDEETGEVITPKHVKQGLYIVKATRKSKVVEKAYNIERHFIKVCIKQNQLTLTL